MNRTALTESEILDELRGLRESLRSRFGVVRIGVFGSVARGEATPDSDVDIVVEMEPNLFKRAALKQDLESRLGVTVDVVRYRKHMNRLLKERIDREAHYA